MGTTGERLMKIETDISYIKVTLDKTTEKLTKFVDCADNKYARKDSLKTLREELAVHKKNTSGWVKMAIPAIISLVAVIIAVVF